MLRPSEQRVTEGTLNVKRPPGLTDLKAEMVACAAAVKAATLDSLKISSAQRTETLLEVAQALADAQAQIIRANEHDLAMARKSGLNAPLLDRLELTQARFQSMVDGMREVAVQQDVIGEVYGIETQPSGIKVGRMRTPLGVVGIVYESRPNVTADAFAICFKSGNGCLLRGGSEAFQTNCAIAGVIRNALAAGGKSADWLRLVETTDRRAVSILAQLDEYLDVLIPRGGRGLIEAVIKDASVPVIKHLDGVCYAYVHKDADIPMALNIVDNGRTYRYGICCSTEGLVVDADITPVFLPKLEARFKEKGVTILGCATTCSILLSAQLAKDEDYGIERLGPYLAVKVVSGFDEAVSHIRKYGSAHTDTIVTQNEVVSREFLVQVDSSSVMVNAPTCFADGKEYGLGAEIGISTDKFHARGPVGVEGLTSVKFIVLGNGSVRS